MTVVMVPVVVVPVVVVPVVVVPVVVVPVVVVPVGVPRAFFQLDPVRLRTTLAWRRRTLN
jgi:hypothetical protein